MNRAFTLVEILVSAVILSILIAGIYGILNIGSMSYNEDMGLVDLQQQARLAMDGMVREIRQTNTNSTKGNLTFADGNTKIIFKIAPPVYGDPWVGPISYYRDVNDVNNDGVVNQTIREYTTGTKRILANDINSLNFSLSGNIVEIQIEAKKPAPKRELSFSLEEKVWLRN